MTRERPPEPVGRTLCETPREELASLQPHNGLNQACLNLNNTASLQTAGDVQGLSNDHVAESTSPHLCDCTFKIQALHRAPLEHMTTDFRSRRQFMIWLLASTQR